MVVETTVNLSVYCLGLFFQAGMRKDKGTHETKAIDPAFDLCNVFVESVGLSVFGLFVFIACLFNKMHAYLY